VVFEEVRRHVSTDSSHAYGGFLATLTARCEQQSIAYQGVPVGTIKRYATGKGMPPRMTEIEDAANGNREAQGSRRTRPAEPRTLARRSAEEGTPFARLKVAQLALKVEAQRLALDESKGRLLDVATANATIDEIASTMRDALLNWPARVAGVIAAELGVEPHLLQTILQQHINELLTEASDRFDPPAIGGEREPNA
jgi:hypothetical protein